MILHKFANKMELSYVGSPKGLMEYLEEKAYDETHSNCCDALIVNGVCQDCKEGVI